MVEKFLGPGARSDAPEAPVEVPAPPKAPAPPKDNDGGDDK